MLRTGQLLAPSQGLRHSASTATSQSTPEASYQGPWRLRGPDFHRQAILSLRLGYVISSDHPLLELDAPEPLGALHICTKVLVQTSRFVTIGSRDRAGQGWSAEKWRSDADRQRAFRARQSGRAEPPTLVQALDDGDELASAREVARGRVSRD